MNKSTKIILLAIGAYFVYRFLFPGTPAASDKGAGEVLDPRDQQIADMAATDPRQIIDKVSGGSQVIGLGGIISMGGDSHHSSLAAEQLQVLR
jgi:hypothetical protein